MSETISRTSSTSSGTTSMPEDYIAPNTTPKCTWKKQGQEPSPHRHVSL